MDVSAGLTSVVVAALISALVLFINNRMNIKAGEDKSDAETDAFRTEAIQRQFGILNGEVERLTRRVTDQDVEIAGLRGEVTRLRITESVQAQKISDQEIKIARLENGHKL